MTPLRGRLAALMVFGALLVAACGGGSSPTETATPGADDEAGEGNGADGSALSGEFATLGGGSIDLAELEGQDVVLWFWAPW